MRTAKVQRELRALCVLCETSLGTGKVCHQRANGSIIVTTRYLSADAKRRIASVSERASELYNVLLRKEGSCKSQTAGAINPLDIF